MTTHTRWHRGFARFSWKFGVLAYVLDIRFDPHYDLHVKRKFAPSLRYIKLGMRVAAMITLPDSRALNARRKPRVIQQHLDTSESFLIDAVASCFFFLYSTSIVVVCRGNSGPCLLTGHCNCRDVNRFRKTVYIHQHCPGRSSISPAWPPSLRMTSPLFPQSTLCLTESCSGTAMRSLRLATALGARRAQPRLSRSVDRPTCAVRSGGAIASPRLILENVRGHIHGSRESTCNIQHRLQKGSTSHLRKRASSLSAPPLDQLLCSSVLKVRS